MTLPRSAVVVETEYFKGFFEVRSVESKEYSGSQRCSEKTWTFNEVEKIAAARPLVNTDGLLELTAVSALTRDWQRSRLM